MRWRSVKKKQRNQTKASLESRLQVLEDYNPDEATLAEIGETASTYFAELFTTSTMGNTAPIYNNVKEMITLEMNIVLVAPFIEDEVKAALRTMSPLKASGQRVNYDKSLLFFSANTADYLKDSISSMLGVRVSTNPEKYLGLPTMVAKSKPSDELVWRCDPTGVYSPKSGYRLLSETAIHQHTLSLDTYSSLFFSFYSSLWELPVPAKCKTFMWRFMHNFVPTFSNLCLRKLMVRNMCPLCELHADTTDHMVFSCSITQQILGLVGLPSTPIVHNQDSNATFATWFLQADKRNIMVIVLTFWATWYARNKLIHEGTVCSVTRVSTFVLAYLREFDSLEALAIPAKMTKDVK
ncbi:hypothetical protein V6N13_120772 [Hibiscus sabdariffa]